MDEVVHIVGHRVGVQLEDITLDLLLVHLLPLISDDDQVVVDEDGVGYVVEVGIGLDVPLHPLLVRDFSIVVLRGDVAHHDQELFQEDEAVVVVSSVLRAQLELRNNFVAIRMEHSQMV